MSSLTGVDCDFTMEKVKNIGLFIWSVKSLFLVPYDIFTDVKLAWKHFKDDNLLWAALTATFLLPSLMFPYHYYMILKFVVLKFKFLFLSRSPNQSSPEVITNSSMELEENNENSISEIEVDNQERKVLNLDGIFAYFEDIPQFILQVYILWKTPVDCFSWDSEWTWDEITTTQSIFTSFLSISATVVPYYEKNMDKEWKLLSRKGFFQHFIVGTFFHVVPKLVLVSWTLATYSYYGCIFFIPLIIGACGGACKMCREKNATCLGVTMIILQMLLGYDGSTSKIVDTSMANVFFLIPLGIAFYCAYRSDDELNLFGIFPSDPFPSRTICFTKSSIDDQQDRWNNLTKQFAAKCNLTFSAESCTPEKLDIIVYHYLLTMIVFMSLGPLIFITFLKGGGGDSE